MEKHVLQTLPKKIDESNYTTEVTKCSQWLVSTLASKNCYRKRDKREYKCRCLALLVDNPSVSRAAGRYMIKWAKFGREEKKCTLNTWIRYSDVQGHKGKLILPLVFDREEDNVEDIFVCRNTIYNMLHVGSRMLKGAMESPTKPHKLANKKGSQSNAGKRFEGINFSLYCFFHDLAEQGLPFATRVVREKSGMKSRDDNPEDVALPPHMTKRQLYAQWCWQRGWKVVMDSRSEGSYVNTKNYLKRPHDDSNEVPLWPTGSNSLEVCSWPKFNNYWKQNFPHLRLRKRGADTCTDCLKFVNNLALAREQKKTDGTCIGKLQ